MLFFRNETSILLKMPAVTRSQSKQQMQARLAKQQMQSRLDNLENSYTIFEFISEILIQGSDVDGKYTSSEFCSLMKKYTCYNHIILHKKYPELDIIKVKYQIRITSFDNDNEEYETNFIYIALPKNVEGNIEDVDINDISIGSMSLSEKLIFNWTIKSIKHCRFIK